MSLSKPMIRQSEIYRYKRDELIGKSVRLLRANEALDKIDEDLKNLDIVGYSTYETIHRRKDETTFPIEISARKFEIEGIGILPVDQP